MPRAVVLPELEALHGVEQSRYHHTDVYDHTLEVLDWTVALGEALRGAAGRARSKRRSRACPARREGQLAALLGEPLADETDARSRRCAGGRSCTTPPSR